MAHIFNTRDIERSLLNSLIINRFILKAYLNSISSEWFGTPERKFIFTKIGENFRNTKSLLTLVLFEHEVDKCIKKENRDAYIVEWNLILGLNVSESPESLIEKLEASENASKVTDICERVIRFIETGNVEDAIKALRYESFVLGSTHQEKPISILTDYEERKELIRDKKRNPAKYAGIKTGFREFDEMTGGLFPAELTLFSAVTGVGKSTILKTIESNIIVQAKNCLHITNEENELQVQTKFDTIFSSIPYLDFKRATVSEDDLKKWEERMKELRGSGHGIIAVKEVLAFTSAVEVERAFVELEQRSIKIDVIVIDYMDHMTPIKQAWGENDEQAKIAADCKNLAVQLNVPVVTATQAATEVDTRMEKGKSFGKLNVYGSKRKIHEANTFIGIMEKDRMTNQMKKHGGNRDSYWDCDALWEMEVLKNRDGPPFKIKAVHLVKEGRVEERTRSMKIVDEEEKTEEQEKESDNDAEVTKEQDTTSVSESASEKKVGPVSISEIRKMGQKSEN
jgi:replicative DNA helicase